MPPSGHIAGVYARVDSRTRRAQGAGQRGDPRRARRRDAGRARRTRPGSTPTTSTSSASFDGNITIWGAHTLAGEENAEWRYINVRRLFNFLRESIDEGTQWVVFEPNAPDLWSKIRRNVSAFLTTVWASGALLGATPEQAFYVRCDETTNPPEVRDLGQVVTEIGVALVKPAEFVIFRISQWAGPGAVDDRARDPRGLRHRRLPAAQADVPHRGAGVPRLHHARARSACRSSSRSGRSSRRGSGRRAEDAHLAAVVRGFFENDGLLCYVVALDQRGGRRRRRCGTGWPRRPRSTTSTWSARRTANARRPAGPACSSTASVAATASRSWTAPGHADRSGRGAAADALGGPPAATARCTSRGSGSPPGAGCPATSRRAAHVAGIYSRSDQRTGAHKAPANEVVDGVLDLAVDLRDDEVGRLYAHGVNCIRALRGRGIRVWGARTLSDDPAWQDVTARRVVITIEPLGRTVHERAGPRAERRPPLDPHHPGADRVPRGSSTSVARWPAPTPTRRSS